MSFPADAVPDGAVFGPHHVYIGLLLALLAVALAWDNHARKEPWVGAAALLFTAFAFVTVWPYYPPTGAALSVGLVTVAALSAWFPFWSSYSWVGARGLLLLGALIAADDVIEHAFGVPTPLDWLWIHAVYPVIPK